MNELFGQSDYSHLQLFPADLTIHLTRHEQEAVLSAYDNGFSLLSDQDRQQVDAVMAKLKDVIWA